VSGDGLENTDKSLSEEDKNEEDGGVNKYQAVDEIVNLDHLNSNDEPIGRRLTSGIAKRLKKRKGKAISNESQPSKATKKSVVLGPTKGWSKVNALTTKKKSLKRNEVPMSDSDYDVEKDVLDIVPSTKKRTAGGKKVLVNVPETLIDNVSFHHVSNVEKWKYVCKRRITLERELEKDALECEQVMKLIDEAVLRKSVSGFGDCYQKLVKEFIVNIPYDCDSSLNKEFRKVFVRGKCVNFSPEVINKFLGRNE